MMIESCLKRKNGMNCELFGKSRKFANFEGFSSDESEEIKLKISVKILELNGQKRSTK